VGSNCFVKLGLVKTASRSSKPRWTDVQWISDADVIMRLQHIDALAAQKNCLALLEEVYDYETSQKIISKEILLGT